MKVTRRLLDEKLQQQLRVDDLMELGGYFQEYNWVREELLRYLLGSDWKKAKNAAWVFTKLTLYENKWLYPHQNELMDLAMQASHTGFCRMVLSLLFRQPVYESRRMAFLAYCYDTALQQTQPVAVRVLCLKLIYEMVRLQPDLLNELSVTLDEWLPLFREPSLRVACRNILKIMKTGKSQQLLA